MRWRGPKKKGLVAAVAAALALSSPLVSPPPAAADGSGGSPPFAVSGEALFEMASRDGRRVVFSSRRPLGRTDRDRELDVYLRAGGRTVLLSTGGSTGDAGDRVEFEGATPDARTVLFRTKDRLAAADHDSFLDLYARGPGGLDLVSAGAPGQRNIPVVGAVSTDGTRVFFTSFAQLVAADEDDRRDVYEYRRGRTRLVSVGTTSDVELLDAAADGSRVIFSTSTGLVAGDTDGHDDIYARRGSTTTLISGGDPGSCPVEPGIRPGCPPDFAAAAANATRVFFETYDRLTPADRDIEVDVYAHDARGSQLISTGPSDDAQYVESHLAAVTPDGRRAFFVSSETFGLSGRTHGALFERRAGRTSLASVSRHGPVEVEGREVPEVAVSRDGSVVVFADPEFHATDNSGTIYRREGRRAETVVAAAPPEKPVGGFLLNVSEDGARVVFFTLRSLVRADRDGHYDIYAHGPRGLSLISGGVFPRGVRRFGPLPEYFEDDFPQFGGASADGRRVFFTTRERLLARDRNDATDLYERGPKGLRLLSVRSGRGAR